jgi:hypothetical protein
VHLSSRLAAAVAAAVLHRSKGSSVWNRRVISFTPVYMYKKKVKKSIKITDLFVSKH